MKEQQVLLRLILLVVACVRRGTCLEYALGFSDSLTTCDDFDNEVLHSDDMELGSPSKLGEEAMYLQGCMDISTPIDPGTLLEVSIAKETETGHEPMWGFAMDLCQSLQDEDAPWYEAFKEMDVTGCPIEAGQYCTKEFRLETDFAKDFMDYKYEGNYEAILRLMDSTKSVISCHSLGLSIYEKQS